VQRASRGLEKKQYDYGGFTGNIELGYPVKLNGGDMERNDEVRFDNESVEGVHLPIDILCLLVDRRKNAEDRHTSAFLVVQEEGTGTGTFKRIGTGHANGRSCFESCEIITLDLI
jgi:hypothetical protein